MRKFISVLLCLVMLAGLLPMEVFAVDLIYQVDVLIDAPVAGQEASFSATAYGPSYHINTITRTDYYNGVLWRDVTTTEYLEPGDVFIEGHTYKVDIRIASNDTNSYLFNTNGGSDPVVRSTVNGNAADEIYGNAREMGLMYTFAPCERPSDGYQVTFYYLYDDIVEVRYTDEDDYIPLFSPTREGYYFYGWYTDLNFRNEAPRYTDEDLILYARWVDPEDICHLRFHGYRDPSDILQIDVVCGEGLSGEVSPPYNPGMWFAGWYTDPNFQNKFYYYEEVTGDMDLYPRFLTDDDMCTIYVYDSADSYDPAYTDHSPIGDCYEPYDPQNGSDDMCFVGWYTDSDFENKFNPAVPVWESTLSLYPRYVDYDETVTVTIYLGADYPEPTAGVYILSGDCYTPATPGREGMVFAGWYTDRDLTMRFYPNEPIYDSISIFPKFVPESDMCCIWIYFDANSPEPYDEIIVEKGEYYDPYWPEYEPDDLFFVGFYTDRNFRHEYDPEVPVTTNVSIFPKYVDRSQVCFIDVYRMADDAEPTASIYVEKGKCYTPAEPGEEGMTFAGWYTDRALTVPYDDTAPLYADSIALYGKFVPKTLQIPQLVSALNVVGGVKVTWQAVQYAEKYRIYVKSNGSNWKKLADTTNPYYTDKNVVSGTVYFYTVRCISADGTSRSAYNRQGISVTYIEAPVVSSITSAYGGVQFKWSACGGAEQYRIYKKVGTKWRALATVTGLTYTDADVTSGTKYTYTLRAYNDDGSEYSSYNGTGWSTTFIASPKISSIQNVATGAKLTWDAVSGATKYRVFIKSSGKWVKLADTTSTSYIHTDAKGGVTYYYTVRSINSNNKFIASYNTNGWKNTFIAVPALPTLTNTSSGVKITFKRSAGAVKYRIFRKTSGGKWTKLVDTTSLSYVDKTAKNGTRYYYTIRCISSNGKKYTSAYNTTGKSIVCKR